MRVTLLLLTLLVCAAIILGAIPQQISYQGRLTSATNTPISGSKNLTFKIYSGAGAVLWNSGAVAVTCTDGLFSVNLGASPQPALPSTIFTDTSLTLGITVESDPELTPRTRLTSNSFSYVAAKAPDYLPLAGGTMTGNVTWVFPLNDVSIRHDFNGSYLNIAGPTYTGVDLRTQDNGSYLIMWDENYKAHSQLRATSTGGAMFISDQDANDLFYLGCFAGSSRATFGNRNSHEIASIEADLSTGGSLYLANSVGDTTVKLFNHSGGSGLRMSSKLSSEKAVLMADSAQGGYLALFNSAGSLTDVFKPAVGNAYTILPDSAICSREIFDEPGMAGNFSAAAYIALSTTMIDLITVSITIPDSGYILLNGKAGEIDLGGSTGENWAVIQIDDTAGGNTKNAYAAAVGATKFPDASAVYFYSASTQRAYYKGKGTYTFRLEGLRGPGSTAGAWGKVSYPTLTAVYYPTGYGPVTVPVSAAEAGQFERATAVAPPEPTVTGNPTPGLYEVDLRELELKAAKARADAEKAERELLQAQLNQQTNR